MCLLIRPRYMALLKKLYIGVLQIYFINKPFKKLIISPFMKIYLKKILLKKYFYNSL